MASNDDFQGLVLKEVTKLDRKELGRGAYGRVYAVNYHGTICAAKEIHSILVEEVGEMEMQRTVESFMREYRQCSTLRHPNVIQFLGVYYPCTARTEVGAVGVQRKMQLPVMVMEMMADSLTSLVEKHEKIPVHIKLSIVHDVSLGLCYLHNHDPPIVHRDLSSNNILLTAHHVAKISDLGVAKVIKADSRKTMTKAPGTVDFMPPESLSRNPTYGPPMDVFSLAGILLHTFSQQWPSPTDQVEFDPKTRKMVALSEKERRQQYLDRLRGEAEVLRPLVEECLDNDPAVRPTITAVCEKIRVSKDVCMKQSPQSVIALYLQVEQKDEENKLLRSEVDQLKLETDNLKYQLCSTKGVSTNQQSAGQSGPPTKSSKIKIEAPPLIPTFTSDKYHMKWTQLADLPAPMYRAYAAVQDKKVYVAGGDSPIDDALHQVYVYDINTDQWGQLPLPGHYYGVPHIIGGKLAIIGGRLSATNERTNKVSTFDETNQTWTSYYPDLLSVRVLPGVFTHLEHVIVAGGLKGVDVKLDQDDVEVLNWVESFNWRKIAIKLPAPMCTFTPIIADGNIFIVGYERVNAVCNGAYKIPVTDITRSQSDNFLPRGTPANWITMTPADHYYTALVPSSSPPVVIGGRDQYVRNATKSDIKIYDETTKSWKNTTVSLSSPRSAVTIATVNDNAIIVIGGCTVGGEACSSSIATVELGQVFFSKNKIAS